MKFKHWAAVMASLILIFLLQLSFDQVVMIMVASLLFAVWLAWYDLRQIRKEEAREDSNRGRSS